MKPRFKRIAIFGDINSIWIKTYLSNIATMDRTISYYIFADHFFEKDIVSTIPSNCFLIDCNPPRKWSNQLFVRIYYFIKTFVELIKKGRFDCFHIHFVNKRRIVTAHAMRKFTCKTVVSFWGSDLLSKNVEEIKELLKYLQHSQIITVGSSEMLSYAEKVFPVNIFMKTQIVRFGVNGLDFLRMISTTSTSLKEKWGIQSSKLVVTIGYNGSSRQNHIEILKQVSRLSLQDKKLLFLVLPVTYGLQEEYKNKLLKIIGSVGCEYLILTEYMENKTVAELCVLTDIFIHGQTTDAFSASVQEHLCAGSLVLNPDWIRYDELKKKNVYYITYDKYEDLYRILCRCLKQDFLEDEKRKLVNNKNIIYGLSSWEALKQKWFNLYFD